MNAPIAAEVAIESPAADFETVFHVHYARIAGVIARVVQDHARAEEIAVEVFLKLWRNSEAQQGNTAAWLYRTAVRQGLDELRRQMRRRRCESACEFHAKAPNPEEALVIVQQQERVRFVLARLKTRQSELLLLRSQGFSFEELASTLGIRTASVGVYLSRARQAFRKEYTKRYGNK